MNFRVTHRINEHYTAVEQDAQWVSPTAPAPHQPMSRA